MPTSRMNYRKYEFTAIAELLSSISVSVARSSTSHLLLKDGGLGRLWETAIIVVLSPQVPFTHQGSLGTGLSFPEIA